MYHRPAPLKEICLDFITDGVDTLVDNGSECFPPDSDMVLVYSNHDLVMPRTISERLLKTLSEKEKLDDFTMGIFDPDNCKLSEIQMPRVSLKRD